MDRSARRFGVPGGFQSSACSAAPSFLAAVAVVGRGPAPAGPRSRRSRSPPRRSARSSVGPASSSSAVCGATGAILEQTTREAEEAGSRLQRARRARPGRRLHRHGRSRRLRRRPARLHEPADHGDPRLSAGGVRRRPRAVAEPDPPGRPRGRDRRVRGALADRRAAPGRVPDDRHATAPRSGSATRRSRCPTTPESGRRVSQGLLVDIDRPQAPRVEADPRRPSRSADRSREPGPRSATTSSAPSPAIGRERRDRRAALRRPRRLQADQRLVRPRGRRPDPAPGRRAAGRRASGPRTSSGARAATSSRCCSTRVAAPTRRSSRPSGSCASCAGRSSSAHTRSSSAARSGSRSRWSPGATAEDLLIQADAAMYAAKAAGKGTFALSTTRGCRPGPGRSSRPPAEVELDGRRGRTGPSGSWT